MPRVGVDVDDMHALTSMFVGNGGGSILPKEEHRQLGHRESRHDDIWNAFYVLYV